jgi:hypothetical protein
VMPFEFVVQSADEDSSRAMLDATRVTGKPSNTSMERFRGSGVGNTAGKPANTCDSLDRRTPPPANC